VTGAAQAARPTAPATTGTPFRLATRGLTKRFGRFTALDGVDVEFHGGELHALVGQNGAGKSTLVKILAGLQRPDAGHVEVDGEPVRLRSPHDAQRLGLGFVHQELALTLDQSVETNLFLGARAPRVRGLGGLGVVSARAASGTARGLLDRVGLTAVDPRAPVSALSVSERWLVAIARGIAREERLLVLDEPTVALSDREVGQLFEVVGALKRAGVAIVFISHRMAEIFAVGDRITVLKDGRRVAAMPVAETSPGELVELMAGGELPQPAEQRSAPRGERILRVRNLTGEGGVRDVSFDLHGGEVLGLAGLVGSRRTETAALLTGLARRSGGELELDGRPYAPKSTTRALEAGVVMVAEDRHDSVFDDLSVAQNVALSSLRSLRRFAPLPVIDGGRERRAAEEMVERLDIRARSVREPAGNLSGGNQQKVVLARWMRCGARVLIFDEPTHGVDVHGKQQIYALMRELAAAGAGVIFISSEMPELLQLADRLIVLREGRSVAELPAGSSERDVLRACYGETNHQEETR